MNNKIKNLVFEGGGVLGIAYLGVLDYLYHNDMLNDLQRVAGTSAGAITACILSFGLPFEEVIAIANTLDYKKIPDKGLTNDSIPITEDIRSSIEPILGDIRCLYRLVNSYGWFSSEYFYQWIKEIIRKQFNHKKGEPYTFEDFKNPALHMSNRNFTDLYIIGTNLTTGTSQVFSYETTPRMEVASAVRISMSIPIFFEAIEIKGTDKLGNKFSNIFCDGGVMKNYPLRIFDNLQFNPNLTRGANLDSLGVRFVSRNQNFQIKNLLDFIWSLILAYGRIQQEEFFNNPMDRMRSISIDPLDISPLNFNITTNDDTYQKLYYQGYSAAQSYFLNNPPQQL